MKTKKIKNKISIIYLFTFFVSIFLCCFLFINNNTKQVFADEINITASQINQYLRDNNTSVYECTLSQDKNVVIYLDGEQIAGGISFVGQGNATVRATENLGTIDASNKNIFAVDIGENCSVYFLYINIIAGNSGAVNIQSGAQFKYSFGQIKGSVLVKGEFNFYAGFISLTDLETFEVDGGIVNQYAGAISHQKSVALYLLSGEFNISGGTINSDKTTAVMQSGGKFVQTGGALEGMASVAISVSNGEYLLSGGEVKSNAYSAITLLSGTLRLSENPDIISYGTYCDIYKSSGVIDATGYTGESVLIAGAMQDGDVVVSNVEDATKFVDANAYGWFEYDAQAKTLVMKKYKIYMPTIEQVKQNNGVIVFSTNNDAKIQKIQWYKNGEVVVGATHNNYKPQKAGKYVLKVLFAENNVSGLGTTTFELLSEDFVVEVEKIQAKTMPTKTQYYHGDLFDDAGMIIEATLTTGYCYNMSKKEYTIDYQNADNIKYGDTYVVIKSLDNLSITQNINITASKKAIDLPTNLQVVYTGENAVSEIETNGGFEILQNTEIVDAGEYQLVLKLTDPQNTYWNIQGQPTQNQTVVFEIIKAQNFIKNFELKSWEIGQEPNTPTATADFGEVELLYSTQKDGEYTKQMPTGVGKYYAKAIVNSTNNYDGAEMIIEFEITQKSIVVLVVIIGVGIAVVVATFVCMFVYFRKKKLKVR